MKKIPPQFQNYFWDVNFTKLDPTLHQTYIIERLLEYGSPKAYLWLKENYSKEAITKILAKSRRLSEKTKNFWQVVS